MPLFRIEQYEICVTEYRVEASSKAEAIARLFEGGATAEEDRHEYIGVDEDRGLPVDEHRQLADELRDLGISVKEIIPSIRSVEQID